MGYDELRDEFEHLVMRPLRNPGGRRVEKTLRVCKSRNVEFNTAITNGLESIIRLLEKIKENGG